MNRADRKRQLREDEKLLGRGISGDDKSELFPLIRVIDDRLRQAQNRKSVKPLMEYIYSNVNLTTAGFRDLLIACKNGCSHCCRGWIAVTPPEAIFIAQHTRRIGSPKTSQKTFDAYSEVNRKTFEDRDSISTICPLLEDRSCSIYAHRPIACRTAVSADANVCERSYNNLTEEGIPTPAIFTMARGFYSVALKCALKRAGLSYFSYEFYGALHLASGNEKAEKEWLGGVELFGNIQKEPEAMSPTMLDQLIAQAFA